MPLYVYEVVLSDGTGGEQLEVLQKMSDPALTKHPETGEPVRRVISGGLAVLPSGKPSADAPESGCGHANCQCGRFN